MSSTLWDTATPATLQTMMGAACPECECRVETVYRPCPRWPLFVVGLSVAAAPGESGRPSPAAEQDPKVTTWVCQASATRGLSLTVSG
jgi:hypothetical protein